MNSLFLGNVEQQVHKDWERRMSKRVIRRSDENAIHLPASIQNFVDNLKRAF